MHHLKLPSQKLFTLKLTENFNWPTRTLYKMSSALVDRQKLMLILEKDVCVCVCVSPEGCVCGVWLGVHVYIVCVMYVSV